MSRARSVMNRSSRIMCAWSAAIMTENLWPRRLNENYAELLQEVGLTFCGGSFIFNQFLLQKKLVPSIMHSC